MFNLHNRAYIKHYEEILHPESLDEIFFNSRVSEKQEQELTSENFYERFLMAYRCFRSVEKQEQELTSENFYERFLMAYRCFRSVELFDRILDILIKFVCLSIYLVSFRAVKREQLRIYESRYRKDCIRVLSTIACFTRTRTRVV